LPAWRTAWIPIRFEEENRESGAGRRGGAEADPPEGSAPRGGKALGAPNRSLLDRSKEVVLHFCPLGFCQTVGHGYPLKNGFDLVIGQSFSFVNH
jgi:hypothetical protein